MDLPRDRCSPAESAKDCGKSVPANLEHAELSVDRLVPSNGVVTRAALAVHVRR